MFATYDNQTDPASVYVAVIAAAVNPGRPTDVKVLLSDYGVPNTPVRRDESCAEAAARLLKSLTGVQARVGPGAPGWVDLAQAIVYDDPNREDEIGRVFVVVYVALMPETTLSSEAQWIELSGVRDPIVSAFVSSVLRKV